jgi:hypothetical protein
MSNEFNVAPRLDELKKIAQSKEMASRLLANGWERGWVSQPPWGDSHRHCACNSSHTGCDLQPTTSLLDRPRLKWPNQSKDRVKNVPLFEATTGGHGNTASPCVFSARNELRHAHACAHRESPKSEDCVAPGSPRKCLVKDKSRLWSALAYLAGIN